MLKSILLLLFTLNLYATLPQSAYNHLAYKSPEIIKIKVLDRNITKIDTNKLLISIKAIVKKILRTSTNLKIGDTIDIKYHRRMSNLYLGPSNPPILEVEKEYPAYIELCFCKERYYVPSVHGESFYNNLNIYEKLWISIKTLL